ncbi:MAG: hypothetical protein ACOYT8_06160 [Candidatus Dependentiae bacterium]
MQPYTKQLPGMQSKQKITVRELRAIFARYNQRSWYRLLADVQKVKLPPGHDSFATIREALLKFKPIKL